MVFRYEYQNGVWVDLEKPTEEEIREVAKEFSISDRIAKEILLPTPSPVVIEDDDHALLVMHFLTQDEKSDDTEIQEIDFVIGKDFVITVRYEVIAPLYHLKKLFETRNLVTGHELITTDVLLEVLFAHLYSSVRDYISHIMGNLERIEKDMFDGRERDTVHAISSVSRSFLHLEAELANHEDPLCRFLKSSTIHGLFDASFGERAERIMEERAQVMRLVKTHRAVATEMRETNIALLEARQNEIMKTLTVITFIFLPLELITFIFSMPLLGMPLDETPNAFWIIIGSMAIVGVLITLLLAKKRWI